MDAAVHEIRLLRHGETAGYEGDLGLSDRGREQAREAAAALAAEAHGAVRRAARAERPRAGDRRGARGGARRRRRRRPAPTRLRQLHRRRRRRGARAGRGVRRVRRPRAARSRSCPAGSPTSPASATVHVSGGDPIALWLTTPLLGFEPPAVAVRRYWRAIPRAADDTLTVVAAHSGPMRALVAHAFARDLGEPDNLEAVAVHLDGDRARVDYRGRDARTSPCRSVDEPDWWRLILRAADAAQTILEVRRVLDDLREAHDGDRVLERRPRGRRSARGSARAPRCGGTRGCRARCRAARGP